MGDRAIRPGTRCTQDTAVGHIKNDGRAFRAIVYNKGATVLHMMRRLVGDDAFFRGIRAVLLSSRALRRSARTTSSTPWKRNPAASLSRFFERWIYGATLPRLFVQLSR